MKTDILIIGGGASGLMAAHAAASRANERGESLQVSVLEKMPRPGRKIMITGKGRCNFTNLKEWNDFSTHIRSKRNFLKTAFYSFSSRESIDFFESEGMKTVVERGDRAFPKSYHASDVVDTLVRACHGAGVIIETESEVAEIAKAGEGWKVRCTDGREWTAKRLIIATGGLSYPGTGSTGDGYRWARELGHGIVPTFPSLTALVPKGYKLTEGGKNRHIDRSTPLSPLGEKLCGISLKNVGVQLYVGDTLAEDEFGDVDFTDGGLEGPVGFQISRKAVKSMISGARLSVCLDLKPGVKEEELAARVKELWAVVDSDPRSRRLGEKERCRILLGKLMPWELIPAFFACHGATANLPAITKALKRWAFPLEGYVGYERAVVTAGGVDCDEVIAKTMRSRLHEGLYFAGEVLDCDCDTGGYNLQSAFSTGALAGRSAAESLLG